MGTSFADSAHSQTDEAALALKQMAISSNEMLKAADQVWGMLDHLAEHNPEEYHKFVEQQLTEGKEMFSAPQPGFCLRCNISDLKKLYINVCKWTRVPKPKTDSDPVAVKGGVLRHVTKNGKKTKHFLIDIAFNPYVLDECAKQQEMEDMLVSLALDFVEDFVELKLDRKSCRKLKDEFMGPQNDIQCSLDEQWKDGLSKESRVDIGDSLLRQLSSLRIPDNSKDTAELPPLRLAPDEGGQENSSKKLIEELSSQMATSESNGVQVPEHLVCIKEADSRHPQRVHMRVTLPGVRSVAEVELEVSSEDIHLSVGMQYALTVQLPAVVNENMTKATFNSRTSILSVTIPCLNVS